MLKVTILLLTIFLKGGLVTTVSLRSPSYAECQRDAPAIIALISSKPVEIGDVNLPIEYVAFTCIEQEQGITIYNKKGE